ncbi:MAG TPA: hypothetical protein VMJ31_09640 [Methylocystis sp.]|nr:hypothetical protein [Methylocystis sp.]
MSSLRINARSLGAPAALGAVFLLIGAVNARAGTDDTGPFSAIGTAIGVTSSEGTIDYRERAKLVVPPDRKSLPEPRAEGEARPPSFPVDQSSAHRQGARAVSAAPPSADEPAREVLTQPPYGYRHPSKDLSLVKDSDKKEKSWWNPMRYLGSGSDDSKPASPGASTQTSPAASTPTSSGPTALATSGASQAGAEKHASSWWNPATYLPTWGSK